MRRPPLGRAHTARWSVALLVGLLLCATAITGCVRSAPPGPANMRSSPPPWPAPSDAVSYIEAAGVEPEPYADLDDPYKVRLRVTIDGAAVTVPAWVGIDRPRAVQAPAHTHDDSGTIWVEGRASRTFTLGQFFTLWGVRLTERCLGATCGTLAVAVDERTVSIDPRTLPLATAKTIELTVSSS